MTTKREFLTGLRRLSEDLRRKIEAEVSGLDTTPEAVRERAANARESFGFFARTYFPHYVRYEPARLHEYLFERFGQVVQNQAGDHEVIAAPRGHAKSTIVTQIGTLWAVLTGRKKYVVIVMDALDQALPMLEAIKAELEFNPRLLLDFPDAAGQGKVWQTGVAITRNGAKIEVFGSGKRIRGRRHGPYRPDLVIGDDLENDEAVRSPAQRDKLMAWLTKSLLSLGAADDSMDVVIIGTVLHYDSVLARLLKNPLWHSAKFKAVIEWPSRMDLWDKWEELLLSQGEGAAGQFYQDRQAEMDAGAVIC